MAQAATKRADPLARTRPHPSVSTRWAARARRAPLGRTDSLLGGHARTDGTDRRRRVAAGRPPAAVPAVLALGAVTRPPRRRRRSPGARDRAGARGGPVRRRG